MMNEQKLISFNDCAIDRITSDDNYWYLYLKCTIKKSCNFSVTININNIPHTTEFGFEYSSYESESCYKVNSPNCYNIIPYHYMGQLQIGNPPYGLVLYMPIDDYLIYTIADVDYPPGTNIFEFLASNGMYTVTPRPESCTTLYTNYNIQTSGVVIGENIESHIFVLNSLGNTVDVAVNHISQLQNICGELQEEIQHMNNRTSWFDVLVDVIKIGASVIFGGGGGNLLKIGEQGISWLKGLSFAEDEEIGAAVINACDRASTVLAPGEITDELMLLKTEELINDTRHLFCYRCFKLDVNYHIEVTENIDDVGEVVKTTTYIVNSISEIDNAIRYEYPILKLYRTKQPISVIVKHIPNARSELGLGESLRDDHILSSAATVKLIENHKKNMMLSMSDYYTKEQVDEKFIDEDELQKYDTKEIADGKYALKTAVVLSEYYQKLL